MEQNFHKINVKYCKVLKSKYVSIYQANSKDPLNPTSDFE
jgi:hypothetical protein